MPNNTFLLLFYFRRIMGNVTKRAFRKELRKRMKLVSSYNTKLKRYSKQYEKVVLENLRLQSELKKLEQKNFQLQESMPNKIHQFIQKTFNSLKHYYELFHHSGLHGQGPKTFRQ